MRNLRMLSAEWVVGEMFPLCCLFSLVPLASLVPDPGSGCCNRPRTRRFREASTDLQVEWSLSFCYLCSCRCLSLHWWTCWDLRAHDSVWGPVRPQEKDAHRPQRGEHAGINKVVKGIERSVLIRGWDEAVCEAVLERRKGGGTAEFWDVFLVLRMWVKCLLAVNRWSQTLSCDFCWKRIGVEPGKMTLLNFVKIPHDQAKWGSCFYKTILVILKHHTDDKSDLSSSQGLPQWAVGEAILLLEFSYLRRLFKCHWFL